jgi:lysylphosphatidylglycerol synthetase-like protein (DUF2156 family)
MQTCSGAVKLASFVFSVLGLNYFLIWHHVSSVTKTDTLFTLIVATAAIISWAVLLGGVIITFWLVGESERRSLSRLVITWILAALPASTFVAQPSAEMPFSFTYFFGFPVLCAASVTLFGQAKSLGDYSASKIEVTLREIGFKTIDQPRSTRCLVYCFFFGFSVVGHHMISRLG